MEKDGRFVESDVMSEVSKMIADHLGVTPEAIRSGSSFVELNGDFDSLTVIEIQTLVEERYRVTLALDSKQTTFPMCVDELVSMIMRCVRADTALDREPMGRHSA